MKDNGAPVDGARIEITGDTAASTVTTGGTFVAYGIAGNVEITITKDGFVPQVHRVIVKAHQTEPFDFALLPLVAGGISPCPPPVDRARHPPTSSR